MLKWTYSFLEVIALLAVTAFGTMFGTYWMVTKYHGTTYAPSPITQALVQQKTQDAEDLQKLLELELKDQEQMLRKLQLNQQQQPQMTSPTALWVQRTSKSGPPQIVPIENAQDVETIKNAWDLISPTN